jgi:peptide/nickel transport system permease protein
VGLAITTHGGLAFGIALLAVVAGLAILGPILYTASATGLHLDQALAPPSLAHPMGTDELGRDIFARFDEGARISIAVGLVVVAVGAVIGGLLGLVSGALGGLLDAVAMRTMDAVLAFPPLILAMAITLALGAGLHTAAIGIIIPSIPWYARVVRSETLRVRALAFVEAVTALGASRRRVIFVHILPQVLPTLLVQAAAVLGYAILSLAALSFIGLGAQIPTPEWGAMITDGLQYALTGQWWVGVFPGLGLLALVTGGNLVADHLREVLDPRRVVRA